MPVNRNRPSPGVAPLRDGMRIIYLLGLIAGIYLAWFAAQSIFDAAHIPIDLTAASGVGQIINYAIVLICAYLFTTLVWRQSVIGFFVIYFQNWRKTLKGFLFCAGLSVTVAFAWYMFVFAAGGARWSSVAWALIDTHAVGKLFLTCLVGIVIAATEEILFRSLAFKYLLNAATTAAIVRAIFLSSIIFALSHRFDNPLAWLDLKETGLLIGLVLLGCLLALVYYLTNSIACAIGTHSGLIWIAMVKKTQIIQVAHSGWDITNSFDPRTGPAAWILFILLSVLFWSLRRWMRKTFAIEDLDLVAAATNSLPPKIETTARPGDDHLAMRHDWLVAILGGVACIASFFAIQKLIEHKIARDAKNFPSEVNQFKAAMSRSASVDAAARATGFQIGDHIRIVYRELTRAANGQVEIGGDAVDLPGDGLPLTILVFAGNKTVFQVQTDGAREDFARRFVATDAAARNVRFSGAFSCTAGEPLAGVVMTPAKTYLLSSFACP